METGAALLWRVKKNAIIAPHKRLKDGSFLSKVYPSTTDRRNGTNGVIVRVIEYMLEGDEDAEPVYRLVTTILEPEQALAAELAALYIERWEIETALDELTTHLRGPRVVLRSKTPELVRQFAVRRIWIPKRLRNQKSSGSNVGTNRAQCHVAGFVKWPYGVSLPSPLRCLEGAVGESPWGFESPSRHYLLVV